MVLFLHGFILMRTWLFSFLVFLFFKNRFSVSNDLKYDAERDLKDIDALSIPVHALNKVFIPLYSIRNPVHCLLRKSTCGWRWCLSSVFCLPQIKYGDTATSEGVLFATYSALIGESQAGGQHRTRLKQILDWCKPNFDGVVSSFTDSQNTGLILQLLSDN